MWKWFRWVLLSIGILGIIFINLLFWGNFGHISDTDYNHPPIFVTHDFIDLNKVDSITKFRSGIGHDYSGNGEHCRSMRHYYGHAAVTSVLKEGEKKEERYGKTPDPANSVEIYAPADGWILSISGENTKVGSQIEIYPDNAKGWNIRLDHVYPVKGIHMLMRIKAGQLIGRIHDGQAVDMTVMYKYRGEFRLASYFQVMTDEVFAEYHERGIETRDQMIIPRAAVDANPWKCDGGDPNTPLFVEDYASTPEGEKMNYVHINGYVPTIDTYKNDKQNDIKY